MTYFESIIRSAGPAPTSPLGPKPTNTEELAARRAEASRLTSLLVASPAFSFVRLGDMDLCLLLAIQEGVSERGRVFGGSSHTGTQACGDPGLSTKHAQRSWEAFCYSNYLDYYDRIWPNIVLLKRLKLERLPNLFRNHSSVTSLIIYTWMEYEFKAYCEGKRVGFVGAEAGVLEALHTNPVFLERAKDYWPETGCQFFHQPRENGSNLDMNLDLIKADLVKFIVTHRLDTLFISLGGAAKILCYELAKELKIRCIDFGAMLRGLCYLGSDGNRIGRSTHSPFFYRLPFDLVMDAVEKTFPKLKPHELLAKAHAQVILDLQKKVVGWTSASWELECARDYLAAFKLAEKKCRFRYWKVARRSKATRDECRRFLHFCGTHNLTLRGRFFLWRFKAKAFLAQILKIGKKA